MAATSDRFVIRIIVGFGVLAIGVLLLELLVLPRQYEGLFGRGQYWIGFGTSLLLAVAIIALGRYVERSRISPSRYRMIGGWFLAFLAGFVLLNVGFLLTARFSFSAIGAYAWVRWAAIFGGAAGIGFGWLWARSVERTVRAERASRAAESYQTQRDELELLNRYLRHDIRNHLTVVSGYLDVLEDHVDGEGESHLETVAENTTAAIELTETARELAEVLFDPDERTGRIALAEVLSEEIDRFESKFPAADVGIDGPVPDVDVVADDLANSVFRNLLANAVEHNDSADPQVRMAVETGPESVTVRIEDNGPGIPQGHRERIFEQGEKGLESEGTGMGLYLVKTLIERYDGRIEIEDADLGGAAFAIELPRAE